VIGGMLYRALVTGYVEYRQRMTGAPVKLPKPREQVVAPAPKPDATQPDAPAAAPPGGPAAAVEAPASAPSAAK
jgi:hypothetical protein